MINERTGIRAMKRGLLAVFLVFTISSASQAGPLGVTLEPYPNILAGFMTSTYNAITGGFAANGWALTLDTGTGQQSITTPFRLQATIDNSGVATNGSLIVGNATSPLLSSFSLLAFAFNAVQGGALEFLFGSPGGSYVPGTYSALKPVDVMLTVDNAFMGTFGSSWFSSSSTAQLREDPPPGVPEPSTLLLMLAGATGLSAGLRKRGV